MVDVALKGGQLKVELRGIDKLLAVAKRLQIPVQQVKSARVDRKFAQQWWHGVRAPGTVIPGLVKAGTFYENGKRAFWAVKHPRNAIVIELTGAPYDYLVLEVSHPEETVAMIEATLSAGLAATG